MEMAPNTQNQPQPTPEQMAWNNLAALYGREVAERLIVAARLQASERAREAAEQRLGESERARRDLEGQLESVTTRLRAIEAAGPGAKRMSAAKGG